MRNFECKQRTSGSLFFVDFILHLIFPFPTTLNSTKSLMMSIYQNTLHCRGFRAAFVHLWLHQVVCLLHHSAVIVTVPCQVLALLWQNPSPWLNLLSSVTFLISPYSQLQFYTQFILLQIIWYLNISGNFKSYYF